MKRRNRLAFREICEAARVDAAERSRKTGALSLRLYHSIPARTRRATARRLAQIKQQKLLNAYRLLPEIIRQGIDSDHQIGLPTLRWPGRGAYHLPADTEFSCERTLASRRRTRTAKAGPNRIGVTVAV